MHYYTKSVSDALNNQCVVGKIVPSKFQKFADRVKLSFEHYRARKLFIVDIAVILTVGSAIYIACR